MTGTTVVTREPEFDEATRTEHEGLTYFDDIHCSLCGNDLEKSTVPNQHYTEDHEMVCGGCATIELTRRELREKHQDEKPPLGKAAFMEGRIVTARIIEPDLTGGGDDGD